MLALGYAGWGPGQLEDEILANGWLSCVADPKIIFSTNQQTKYEDALGLIGANFASLSSECGHS